MSGNKCSLKLRIRKAGTTIRETHFEQDSLILGSGAGAAVRLDDPCVSTLHVMLKLEKNGVTAIDLGSEHGTRVGNNLIRQPVPLNPGDVLRIGAHEVEVMFGDAYSEPPLPDFSSGLDQPPAPSLLGGGLRGRNPFQAPAAVAAAMAPVVDREPKNVTPLRPAPRIVPRARTRAEENAWRLLEGPLPKEAVPTASDHALQVTQLWGDQILAVEHFGAGVDIRVGESRRNAVTVYTPLVGESHPLAISREGKLDLVIPVGAEWVVYSGDATLTPEALSANGRVQRSDLGFRITLELEERARIELGATTLFLRHVKPAPSVPVKRLKDDQERFLGIVIPVLVLVAAAVAVIAMRPVKELSDWEAGQRARDAYVSFLAHREPPRHIAPAPKPKKKDSGVKEGEKAKGDEGKMGKPEAKPEEAAPSRKGAPLVNPHRKELDRKKVMHSGLLGAIHSDAASDVFGPGGLGTGINKALGGLKGGAALSDAHGIGGLGTRGEGAGAGGKGLGIGGLGTKGMGHGAGGYGTVDLGGKGHAITRIIPGRTTVVGGLSREVIERVIRQHQSEIKYCYEIELNQRPDLAGKVAVAFTIGGTGDVSTARVSESTLHDSTTEQCMLSKIRRWKFPQPVGGGTVDVNFPWIFKPAG